MVGSMFIADAHEKISVQTNEAILLALYEAVHLNRNFITVLAQSHPEMGLVTTPVSPTPTTPATPLGTTPPSSDGEATTCIIVFLINMILDLSFSLFSVFII
ncbi:rCG57700, isoform CRA_b, partial [Rattus norvegicus]